MRIYISLAFFTFLSIGIKGEHEDIFATELIDAAVIEYLDLVKPHHTASALSTGIPNSGALRAFFQKLSENFQAALETLKNAQLFVSVIQPSSTIERFDNIIENFVHNYQGYYPHADLQNMQQNVIETRYKLSGYADEIAHLKLVPFIGSNKFELWTHRQSNNFGHLRNDKKLVEYLTHVNRLIASIRNSIRKNRRKIDHGQLKRLGKKIFAGVEHFFDVVDERGDVNSSLTEINEAIDGLRNANNRNIFNNLKIYAGKILHDLNELKQLMDIQWTDMDTIIRTQELPRVSPKVTLAT